MRATVSAAFLASIFLRAAVSLPLPGSAPKPAPVQQLGVGETQPTASAPSSEMTSAGFSSTAQPGQSTIDPGQQAAFSAAQSSVPASAAAASLATSNTLDMVPAGAGGDVQEGAGTAGASKAVTSGADSLAGDGVAATAPMPQVSANETAAMESSGNLVFDGADNLISGGTGFGDSPPPYTGKQEWPELVGENAALAKAQLIAETHLQVILVPAGSAVTQDYRTNRIRIYYDPATFVVVQPRPSIG